jgi:5S rRNA maturation endonuclease (ribonuclease M5)
MIDDATRRAEQRHHVLEQLACWSGRKGKSTETYTFISCPFHNEKTPSGQVYHGNNTAVPGYFKCLGCGHKAFWDELASVTGMQPFHNNPYQEISTTPLMIDDGLEAIDIDTDFTLKPLPVNKVWRTFNTEFLSKVGVQLLETEYGTNMLYMPVNINGKTKGYIKARLTKDPTGQRPSYINSKGTWSKTHGLFPFDYTMDLMRKNDYTSVVLVEGPRDALRLLSHGIPALSILGTNTWSEKKVALLEIYGVKQVLLMMDGDEPGRLAACKLYPQIAAMIKTKLIKLWAVKDSPYQIWCTLDPTEQKLFKSKLWDPGNCPDSILTTLKQLYFTHVAETV